MSLFGEARDISLFRHINRELINNIIEQQVGYYKIVLDRTKPPLFINIILDVLELLSCEKLPFIIFILPLFEIKFELLEDDIDVKLLKTIL